MCLIEGIRQSVNKAISRFENYFNKRNLKFCSVLIKTFLVNLKALVLPNQCSNAALSLFGELKTDHNLNIIVMINSW